MYHFLGYSLWFYIFSWLRFIDPKFLFWAACKNKNQNLFLRSHLLLFFIFVVQGFKWWAMRNLFFSSFFFFCLVCGFWDFVKKNKRFIFYAYECEIYFFPFLLLERGKKVYNIKYRYLFKIRCGYFFLHVS